MSGYEHADHAWVETARHQALAAAHLVGVIACAVLAVTVLGSDSQWERADLFVVLLVFAVVSEVLTLEFGQLRVSGCFAALMLAMTLLGPVPAAVIGVVTVAFDSLRCRPKIRLALSNLFVFGVFTLAGGVAFQAILPLIEPAGDLAVAAVIVPAFVIVNALNFLLVAGYHALADARPLMGSVRHAYLPVLPSQVASGALCACVAYLYLTTGFASVVLLAVVILVFTYLVRTNLESQERANELEIRTTELAGLQLGLVTTILRTLALRDKMTARHSAAVARYAREMARRLGLDEREQEMIHTAGLLHDIGKFIFPDSILLADRKLSAEDFEIVKLHPEQGARIVRRISGYEAVADVILAHHERVDGNGYPNGLAGEQIPIGARIIAVADTYDVMTARDSYQTPVSAAAAVAELQAVAGKQLDSHVVEMFIELIQDGGLRFRHADDADFEAELSIDERVQDYAKPRRKPVAA